MEQCRTTIQQARVGVKIRLKRFGTKKRPYYRLVVMDSRAPRDGRALEEVGFYHPIEVEEKQLNILNLSSLKDKSFLKIEKLFESKMNELIKWKYNQINKLHNLFDDKIRVCFSWVYFLFLFCVYVLIIIYNF